MDGEATAREIRKIVGPETLIIIISAYDWSPIESKAKEIGINGFIAKPFFSSSFYNWLSDPSIKEHKGRDKEIVVQDNTKKRRVLLAEDNEFNAEVAQDFLDMAGYTAEVVGDGEQAVKAFETHEPGYYSMIFMDIQMPVMNGFGSYANDPKPAQGRCTYHSDRCNDSQRFFRRRFQVPKCRYERSYFQTD